MTELKPITEEIIIRKEEKETKEGTKFDTYVFNKDGNAVKLSFRKVSNNLSVIPYGISKIVVENLKLAVNSFYPKYYATFKEVIKA